MYAESGSASWSSGLFSRFSGSTQDWVKTLLVRLNEPNNFVSWEQVCVLLVKSLSKISGRSVRAEICSSIRFWSWLHNLNHWRRFTLLERLSVIFSCLILKPLTDKGLVKCKLAWRKSQLQYIVRNWNWTNVLPSLNV